MTCRPDQSQFLNPEIIKGNTTERCSSVYTPDEEHDMVLSVDYYIKDSFKNGLFDSIKNVYNPSTGLALGLMCGIWGIHCTPERYFGNANKLLTKNSFIMTSFGFSLRILGRRNCLLSAPNQLHFL